MLNEYCIGVIGVKNTSNPQPSVDTITHDKQKYELLIDINFARLALGRIQRVFIMCFRIVLKFSYFIDVRSSPEFCFKPITYHYDEENVHLGLFFRPWLSTKQAKNIRSKYRIIQRFFNINLPLPIDDSQELVEEQNEDDETANANSMPSVSELYSMLRETHEKNNTGTVHHALMPTYFVPELRSYQLKALHWMLSREKSTEYSLPEFVPITCHAIPNETFYFNYRTVELMDYNPGSLKIPSGGILAGKHFHILLQHFRIVTLRFNVMP